MTIAIRILDRALKGLLAIKTVISGVCSQSVVIKSNKCFLWVVFRGLWIPTLALGLFW